MLSMIKCGTVGEFRPTGRENRVSCGCVLDGELIFIPSEIPRRGVFALWG